LGVHKGRSRGILGTQRAVQTVNRRRSGQYHAVDARSDDRGALFTHQMPASDWQHLTFKVVGPYKSLTGWYRPPSRRLMVLTAFQVTCCV